MCNFNVGTFKLVTSQSVLSSAAFLDSSSYVVQTCINVSRSSVNYLNGYAAL